MIFWKWREYIDKIKHHAILPLNEVEQLVNQDRRKQAIQYNDAN